METDYCKTDEEVLENMLFASDIPVPITYLFQIIFQPVVE